MNLEQFKVQVTPIQRFFECFQRNSGDQKRFLITARDGSHLVGVPSATSYTERVTEETVFLVQTSSDNYQIPFRLLAFAEELAGSQGLRPSDGMPQVPEPCVGPKVRVKQQKFKILDSPDQLRSDLEAAFGKNGAALIYLDVDNFKALNTKYTETKIDQGVLPELQNLIALVVKGHGYSYAEGGDEMIVLLPNTGPAVATAFAETLRSAVETHVFKIDKEVEKISISVGVASCEFVDGADKLQQLANDAKAHSKKSGKNCTTTYRNGSFFIVPK